MENSSDNTLNFQHRLIEFYNQKFPSFMQIKIKRELKGCESFIELGCGSSSPAVQLVRNMFTIGVDGFLPSLKSNKKAGYFRDYILADLMYLPLKENSFDCVAAFDVIEHLVKAKAVKLIEDMEKVAERKVIISTPNGFNSKCHPEDNNPLQIHRSGWTTNEISRRGYVVLGIDGLLKLRGEQAKAIVKPEFLGALLARFSDLFVFWSPNSAFSLLCVKNKQ